MSLDLRHEQAEIAPSAEGYYTKLIGEIINDLQRLRAYGASGAQNADGFHRDPGN